MRVNGLTPQDLKAYGCLLFSSDAADERARSSVGRCWDPAQKHIKERK